MSGSSSPRRSERARPRAPRLRRSLAAAGMLALGAAGAAQEPAATPAPARSEAGASFSAADRELWTALRASGDRLARLAQRALKFTPTPDVLVLAHQVLDDHARLAAQLARLAPETALADPAGGTPPNDGNVGEEFDRAFLAELTAETERALEICTRAVREADAPVLRAFATDAIVSLDRHLREARELQRPARDATQ